MNKLILNRSGSFDKEGIWVVSVSILYLGITAFFVGIRFEHLLITGLYNGLFFISPRTRKFILAFTIFVIFGILYDWMKVYPNYRVNTVDISQLYFFEQKTFGFIFHGQFFTPNKFFAFYHTSFLDLLSGFFYINWIPVPLAFAVYLFFYNKQQFLHFSLTFLLVNLLGFIIYYIHPAAPPWYINQYGFDFHPGIPGSTAGLARFDDLVHLPVFNSIYSRNSNVFAALPSLHCAYPVIVLFYAVKSRLGLINWFLAVFMAGIWFAAVYSGHHYVTDMISGIISAIAGILIFQKILFKTRYFRNWINRYQSAIT